MDERILLDKENGWKMNFLSGFEGKFVIAEVTLDVFLTSTPTSMGRKRVKAKGNWAHEKGWTMKLQVERIMKNNSSYVQRLQRLS